MKDGAQMVQKTKEQWVTQAYNQPACILSSYIFFKFQIEKSSVVKKKSLISSISRRSFNIRDERRLRNDYRIYKHVNQLVTNHKGITRRRNEKRCKQPRLEWTKND
jgi:hypothetical protein